MGVKGLWKESMLLCFFMALLTFLQQTLSAVAEETSLNEYTVSGHKNSGASRQFILGVDARCVEQYREIKFMLIDN